MYKISFNYSYIRRISYFCLICFRNCFFHKIAVNNFLFFYIIQYFPSHPHILQLVLMKEDLWFKIIYLVEYYIAYIRKCRPKRWKNKKNVDFITDPTKTFICSYRFSTFSEYCPARSDNIWKTWKTINVNKRFFHVSWCFFLGRHCPYMGDVTPKSICLISYECNPKVFNRQPW